MQKHTFLVKQIFFQDEVENLTFFFPSVICLFKVSKLKKSAIFRARDLKFSPKIQKKYFKNKNMKKLKLLIEKKSKNYLQKNEQNWPTLPASTEQDCIFSLRQMIDDDISVLFGTNCHNSAISQARSMNFSSKIFLK